MSLERFINDRQPVWDELTKTVEQLYQRGARRVGGEQVGHMVHLYRDVSADLARLRALEADPELIRRINRLVTRAHGQIYRGTSARRGSVWRFFRDTYPRLFRETWRYTAASILLTSLFAVMAFYTVPSHPELVTDIMGGADAEFRGEKSADDIRDRFKSMSAPLLSSIVTVNNINVALMAFGFGVTFGIGTVYVLIVNGTMLGGFAGVYAASGAGTAFWVTILPHGALELSAIFIAGGAGLQLGHALWCPGRRTRRRALREEAVRAGKIALGLIPAFVVAGIYEGFITPSDDLPEMLKLGLGVATAVVFWLYLILGGRGEDRPASHQVAS